MLQIIRFILNKDFVIDADDTIFTAEENVDGLTMNVSWEDKEEESGYSNVDYGIREVENKINKKIWIVIN